MSSELTAAPAEDDPRPVAGRMTYLLNPALAMSSGKVLAQVAHAATMAAATGRAEPWVAAGCPGRVVVPSRAGFAALCGSADVIAQVEDAGLTEVPPGTLTVLALAPA
jgi:peptidyl-tRNA hydrolase